MADLGLKGSGYDDATRALAPNEPDNPFPELTSDHEIHPTIKIGDG